MILSHWAKSHGGNVPRCLYCREIHIWQALGELLDLALFGQFVPDTSQRNDCKNKQNQKCNPEVTRRKDSTKERDDHQNYCTQETHLHKTLFFNGGLYQAVLSCPPWAS
jgi:hypothetical protein